MKTWIYFLLCSPSLAATLGGPSKISKVKVFNGRASIERTQVVTTPKGAHTIWFRGVTPLVDRDSLKGSLGKKKSVRILGIRVRERHLRHSENKALVALQSEHRDLLQRREKIRQQVQRLSQENQHVLELFDYYRASFGVNLHNNRWSSSQFASFLKLTRGEQKRMHGKWKNLFLSFLKVEEAIEANVARRSQLASPGDSQKVDLALDVIADGRTSTSASIRYLVPQASWTPAYDVRIGKKRATLEQYALVTQSTGEDWTNVELELSHHRAALRAEPPALSPYQLTYRKVEQVETVVSGKQESNVALALGAAPSSSEERSEQSFQVPGSQTIQSGRSEMKLLVATKSAPYRTTLTLVAGKLPRAFYRGVFSNPFSWNLDKGPLHIFDGGQFLQQTHLEPTPAGGEIAVNTGMEDRVGVKRFVQAKTDTAGLISKRKVHQKIISSDLKNRATTPLTIRVWEQVPISQLEEVKVSWESNLPPGRKLASLEKEGWQSWPVQLAPGETKQVQFTLKAEAPASMPFSW